MPVSLTLEASLWDGGAGVIVGMDEVGRGALAGPVSVGVVALAACESWPKGLADSKELTPARRESIALELSGFGLARAVGSASSAEVDERGIVAALRLAGWRALASIALEGIEPDAILLDGSHDWLTPPAPLLFSDREPEPPLRIARVTTVVRGDARCVSIAAASVLAKVARDAVMREVHDAHPDYGWRNNKGYGSPDHLAALARLGPTSFHRCSWNLPGLASTSDVPERMMDA